MDDRNAFLIPPRVELKLAETEEHMALGSLCSGLFEVCQSTAKDFLSPRSLSFVHEEEPELVLSTRHQGFVVFQRIQRERLVSELDRSTDVASLLVSYAPAVIPPTQSGQVAHRPGSLKCFLVLRVGSIEGVVLDVVGGDMSQHSTLR